MITMKEARRIHRKTQTYVTEVSSGYRDHEGRMLMVRMRLSRIPFRRWVRNAWRVDLSSLNEQPSTKLRQIVGSA